MARTNAVRVAVFSVLMLAGAGARGQDDKTFEGEIADSQCAMNVHSLSRSHKEMIDMGLAGKTAVDCSHYCVKQRGGKYVLQTKHDVFKLDRQDLVEGSAGMKVRVTGVLDLKTNTILLHSVEPVSPK
jgi:hypothetical protein